MVAYDGGPAFARPSHGTGYENVSQEGMSLRAYLAGKAMQAYISADTDLIWPDAKIAEMSVNAADALIAELAKEKGE